MAIESRIDKVIKSDLGLLVIAKAKLASLLNKKDQSWIKKNMSQVTNMATE